VVLAAHRSGAPPNSATPIAAYGPAGQCATGRTLRRLLR